MDLLNNVNRLFPCFETPHFDYEAGCKTEMVRSIWFLTEISGILGWIESAPPPPFFLEIEGNRFGQFLNTGYLKDQSELVKRGKPRVSKSHLIGWENEAMSS